MFILYNLVFATGTICLYTNYSSSLTIAFLEIKIKTNNKKKINKRGGLAVPVQVDHEKHDQIESLFKQIKSESGHLDILVNNAYKGVETIFSNIKSKFWQSEPSLW
jgi:NAD(P)-dependent dehydrogenase (short-subunit alcohol dehydrogenase family)